jgi:Protein of unknown function (DUF1566)
MKRFSREWLHVRATAVLVVAWLFVPAVAHGDPQVAPETRVRGYWVDPSTGLMWAGKDNFGRDVNWVQALKYCLDLRLGGYADWRLPTIRELEGIYDKSANALGLAGKRNEKPQTFHVKGDLFLTGYSWSAGHFTDAGGRLTGWAVLFDFINGRRFEDEVGFRTFKRALCVRGDVQRSLAVRFASSVAARDRRPGIRASSVGESDATCARWCQMPI